MPPAAHTLISNSTPVLITAAGDITATVEQYRQVLGGENNGGDPGWTSFGLS